MYREGLALVTGQPESQGLAILLTSAAEAAFSNGLRDEARAFCQQAVSLAERMGETGSRAESLLTWAMILTLGDQNYEAAHAALQQALTLAQSAGQLRLIARAQNYLGGFAHSAWGDYRAERHHRQQAAEAYRRMGAASHELNSLSVAANTSMLLGEFTAAEAMLARLRELLRIVPGSSEAEFVAQTVEIPLLRYQGEWAEAIRCLQDYQMKARQRNDLNTLGSVDISLGEIFLELNQLDKAAEVLQEGQESWRPLGWGETWPLCLLCAVRARQGQSAEAHRLLAEAREQAGPHPLSGDELRLPLATARLAMAEQHWPEAWAAFETVIQTQTRRELRWDRAQTLREWAEAHLSRKEAGNVERACELLRESLAEFEAMNVPKYAALVRERLLSLGT